jgi:hypothetical protein
MQEISLPQFRGRCNPYDELWALSFALGKQLWLQASRVGSGDLYETTKISTEAYKCKYDTIVKELEALTEDERAFLLDDSKYCSGYGTKVKAEEMITELRDLSFSTVGNMADLVSENFLCATMGTEQGKQEFERRKKILRQLRKASKNWLLSAADAVLIGDKSVIDKVAGLGQILSEVGEMTSDDFYRVISIQKSGYTGYDD